MATMTCATNGAMPLVTAVAMGYGHMRAAHAIAEATGWPFAVADRPPLAGPDEARLWRRMRAVYDWVSRASQTPIVGRPSRALLDSITAIPHLYPYRDQSAPTLGARALDVVGRRGLGAVLAQELLDSDATLVATFYAPALLAASRGCRRIVCVVTDSDINRVWVATHPDRLPIDYCVPTERALRRLRAYGVPRERIHFTGFPLPAALVGDSELVALRTTVARRVARLDPAGTFREPYREELARVLGKVPESDGVAPLLAFAVGGAGAQAGVARRALPSLTDAVHAGRLRLALVAGTRVDAAESMHRWVRQAGLERAPEGVVRVVHDPDALRYFASFNALVAETDALWTKPSELTFFAALGLPLVFAWPVGVHERLNRRWAIQRGAGLKQDDPGYAWQWLREWLDEGTLAAAAWSGLLRLPKFGTARIVEVVERVDAAGR
jgi:hypothetical protein